MEDENRNEIPDTLPAEEPLFTVEISETPKKKRASGFSQDPNRPLTARERAFVHEYLKTNNVQQSAIKAGYSAKTARTMGSRVLSKPSVAKYIAAQREKMQKAAIASAQEVMEYFTRVMKGEEKDQFGLDASLAERTKAAQELAKRTIDLENRLKGQPDNVLEIRVDWGRD